MSIAPFPHRYIVNLEQHALRSLPRTEIRVGAPPQFGGSDEVWSPEELLVGAAITCLQTTFEAFAKRDGLEIQGWSATGTGVLDRGPGGPQFTELTIHVTFSTRPELVEKAHAVLSSAERACIISRSLACPVHVTSTIHADLPELRAGA